ncbi:MAG: GNAT family N-acetyltransferase [Aeromicrobium sp.]
MSSINVLQSAPNGSVVVLADGTYASIRKLLATDRPQVEALFAATSPANLYTRFFTFGTSVVERHVEHLFSTDSGMVTYVIERAGLLLGIADVEQEDSHTAEIAFLVADDAHGLGIGTLLLELAADDAHERGISTFVADVLAVNHPMIEVFRDAGFDVELINHHDDISVRMGTLRTSAATAATAARHTSALNRNRDAHPVDVVED